ncbi:hypothetical protein ACJJTC_019668 [Scirpophaga incertulas]
MAQKQRASDIIGKALRFSKSVKRRIHFDEIKPNKVEIISFFLLCQTKDTSIDNTINFTTSSTSELMACQAMATTHTDMTETSKMSIPINDETLLSYDLSLQGQSDKLPIVQTEITHVTDELMPQTPIINNVTLQEQSNRQDTLEREIIKHQLEGKILWPPSIATPEIMTLISNKTSDLIEPIASTSSNEVVQSPLMLNSNEKTDPTVAKKKRKVQLNKQLFDYLSDEDDFTAIFGEQKRLRESGQSYTKKDGTKAPAKEIKPNPCMGKKCGNNCDSVTNEKRKSIFDYFWSLTKTRRRDWLVSMTQKIPIKRKRSQDSDKRSYSYKYSITEGEGKRTVCLQFLAATLDVGIKFIQYTVQTSESGLYKEDNRGRCEPFNKTKESTITSVVNFLKALPAVPSHYCRKNSSRVYLPSEFKNLSNLYQIYKKSYLERGIDIVSERVFRSIFNERFNIGFHVPRKDKCVKCLTFGQNKDKPEIEEQRKQHEKEKIESYERFKAHQNIHKTDPSTLCASFDF